MQSRAVERLAARIRQLRERRRPLTYSEICRRLGLLKQDGSPDTALAYQIAYKNFEPVKEETLRRLGLPLRCHSCHRLFSDHIEHKHRAPRELSPAERWWQGLPTARRTELKEFLFNTQEMEP